MIADIFGTAPLGQPFQDHRPAGPEQQTQVDPAARTSVAIEIRKIIRAFTPAGGDPLIDGFPRVVAFSYAKAPALFRGVSAAELATELEIPPRRLFAALAEFGTP